MSEWKEVRLGDTCTIFAGGDAPKGRVSKVQTERFHIPIFSNGITDEGLYGYTDEAKVYEPATTISARGTIGVSFRRVVPYFPIVRLISVIGNKDTWDSDFLYYRLKKSHISGDGSVQAQLTVPMISNYAFNIPDLPTQQRIASILSSLDAKIENNNKINAKLEEIAQNLFKEWFVDFGPFKNGKFVESELGLIPEGWRVGTLDELTSLISRGVAPKYDDDSDEIILGQTCVRNNLVTLNRARKHKPKVKNEKWVQYGDVLINSTGIGSLGRVGQVYFNKNNIAIDTHLTIVRPSCELYRWYVGRNLLSRQDEIENMAVGSTGQTELPRESVKSMKLLIPKDEIMKRFNGLIEPINLQMETSIQENQRLATLRDTLLPKLMSGEIEV